MLPSLKWTIGKSQFGLTSTYLPLSPPSIIVFQSIKSINLVLAGTYVLIVSLADRSFSTGVTLRAVPTINVSSILLRDSSLSGKKTKKRFPETSSIIVVLEENCIVIS